MQRLINLVLVISAFVVSAQAQSLVSYSSSSAQDYGRALCLSPASPAGGTRGTAPTIPALAATGFPLGGAAVDQQGRRFFYSNGNALAAMPLPSVPVGPGPFGQFPLPAFFGQITGLAYSPASTHLWITNGWLIGEYNFIGGVFVTGPWPTPYAGTPTRFTGLEFDSATGTVMAVTEFSELWNFTPGGAVLGSQTPLYVPPGLATGLALDSATVNTAGLARSPYVSYGNTAVHWWTGTPVPLSTGNTQGLAFVALPADLPQGAICGGMPMDAWVNSPSYTNNAGFSLELTGGPSAAVVILGIDVTFLPLPIVLPSLSNLWLNPASPSLLTFFPVTNIAGNASFPIPLFAPPGLTAYVQWAAICPAGLQLYCSDMLQISISFP